MPQQQTPQDIFDTVPGIDDSFLSGTAPEDNTGVLAGLKRGVSNLNPMNWVEPPAPYMNRNIPPAQRADMANEAMTTALQHPVRTLLNQIPLIGPYLAHMAETAPHDPYGAAAESAVTLGVPAAIGSIPTMSEIRGGLTRAEIPQLAVRVANTPLWRGTGAGPVLDYVARRMYEPSAPTSAPMPPPPYQGEFVADPHIHPGPPIDVPYRPVNAPEAPTPPPRMLRSYEQPTLKQGPSPQRALPPPAPTQPLHYGVEEPLPPQKNVDITPQEAKPVGRIKKKPGGFTGEVTPETPKEQVNRSSNFGRTARRYPKKDAKPYVPPKE